MSADFYTPLRLDQVNPALQEEILQNCSVDISTCMECGKCSGGCSNGHIFDFTPRKIIQLIKLGQEEKLLHLDAIWVCLSCQLCVDRCPSGIDIPRIMDYLREKAYYKGVPATREEVKLFHELMLKSISKTGRVAEAPLAIAFNLKTKQYFKDADLGCRMFFKGKLNPLAPRVKNMAKIHQIFSNRSTGRGGSQ